MNHAYNLTQARQQMEGLAASSEGNDAGQAENTLCLALPTCTGRR